MHVHLLFRPMNLAVFLSRPSLYYYYFSGCLRRLQNKNMYIVPALKRASW